MGKNPLDTKDMIESSDDFGAAYELHVQSVYRFLLWRTQDADLAEDLTSNVFEKAWRARGSFHGGSPAAWFHTIARNVLIDYWRKRRELPIENEDALPEERTKSMDEALDQAMEMDRIRAALDTMPADMRLVITMRFIEGHTSKQVAARLGLGESNVRVIQYRGLRRLRKALL